MFPSLMIMGNRTGSVGDALVACHWPEMGNGRVCW